MESMIGKRIKEARRRAGLTQVELAELLNVSPKTVSCYERGLQSPWDAQKIELSNLLHISIDYLLGLSDTGCPPLRGKHVIEIEEDLTEEELAELRAVVKDWLTKHTKKEK